LRVALRAGPDRCDERASVAETLRAVLEHQVARPSAVRPGIPLIEIASRLDEGDEIHDVRGRDVRVRVGIW